MYHIIKHIYYYYEPTLATLYGNHDVIQYKQQMKPSMVLCYS